MVNSLKFYLILLSFSFQVSAQDTLIKSNGDEVQSKVLEIGVDYIQYKRYSNLDGPKYTIKKTDVFMIKYENGEKDIFYHDDQNNDNTSSLNKESIDDVIPMTAGAYVGEITKFSDKSGNNQIGFFILVFISDKVYRMGLGEKKRGVKDENHIERLKEIFTSSSALNKRLDYNLIWEGKYTIQGRKIEIIFPDITNQSSLMMWHGRTLDSKRFASIPDGKNPLIHGQFFGQQDLEVTLEFWPTVEFKNYRNFETYKLKFEPFYK